jgi:CRP-like cAMP-binding protein
MATPVRERVQRHRLYARTDGLIRVDVELPRDLVFALRQSDESLKALMLRALTALKAQVTGNVTGNKPSRKPLPETPERQAQVTGNVSGNAQARFIDLWNQGVETKDIAEMLGITRTAAQSRANKLQRQGLIQPRPRGGDYPSRRARARQSPQ